MNISGKNHNIDYIIKTLPGVRKGRKNKSENSLEDIWTYLVDLDLFNLQWKICQSDPLFPYKWDESSASDAINQYKMFLYINAKYLDEFPVIPPSLEIDEIWHHHILDTRSYFNMSNFVFGEYFHHFPYFGMRGSDDNLNLKYSFDITLDLFELEFGMPIYRLRDYDRFEKLVAKFS